MTCVTIYVCTYQDTHSVKVADYYEMTYSIIYGALTNNVVEEMSYFRKLHKINRKKIDRRTRPYDYGSV